MATGERRIAWLISQQGLDDGRAATKACLTMAAEAGFGVVAMSPVTATGVIRADIEAEAARLGLQCILANDAADLRLNSVLGDAERWSQARELSRDGFDGFILCEGGDSRSRAESLHATARALLRDLDQLDWEAHH